VFEKTHLLVSGLLVFQDILSLIAQLRAPPAQHDREMGQMRQTRAEVRLDHGKAAGSGITRRAIRRFGWDQRRSQKPTATEDQAQRPGNPGNVGLQGAIFLPVTSAVPRGSLTASNTLQLTTDDLGAAVRWEQLSASALQEGYQRASRKF
jgi:hypothetical protein